MILKVISFNIRYCDDKDGNSIAERAPRLEKVCHPFDADVIGFQEYTDPWVEQTEKYFGGEYEIFCKWRAESNHEAATILWKKNKFECLDRGYFWLSDTPEVESRGWDERFNCYRICQWVILKDKETGTKFTFMNTHYGFGDKGQCSSADLIYTYCKKISSYPTFVTGDFNMNPKSLGYAQITKYFTDVNAVTLKDFSDTFHGYDPSVFRDEHIDYCFVDENVKPLSLKVLDETFDGKFPSDHYGLFIELDI